MVTRNRASEFPAGPRGFQIRWYNNPFESGQAQELVLALKRGLAAHTAGFAKQVEQYARDNATWQDRTGDARRGLTAEGRQRLTQYTIVLYHTVDYGIWLEVRWAGKYAIIDPTIRVMGERLMQSLEMADLVRKGT